MLKCILGKGLGNEWGKKGSETMARTVGIGYQDFETVRREDYFYIDKTHFIKEWWEGGDQVTLIARPRRFGKTLTMSMTEAFFSVRYEGREDLFQGLGIWKSEKFQKMQGKYPVINLSFANIKETNYDMAHRKICQTLANLYQECEFLLNTEILGDRGKGFFQSVLEEMDDMTATMALHQLSIYLSRYYNKKVIILLDEYDTPMQEAYVNGYWEELSVFIRNLFNSTFKTNPYLERAIMTGITRVSKESIFSDLNNLEVVTTTSGKYVDCFGFTEEEVFAALDEYCLSDKKQDVKSWYDGFTFGNQREIYNPWSILNFLDKREFGTYWANSSSNSLVSKQLREGGKGIKQDFEQLMRGTSIKVEMDEQIIYNQLSGKKNGIWSLLLASGYLKVHRYQTWMTECGEWKQEYELMLTNLEVRLMFRSMIHDWFAQTDDDYNDFVKALLSGDVKAMNMYMNKITLTMFSYFDTGKKPSWEEPERFYHGFILGLMVELSDRYVLTSNRESGFGRYDVMLEPRNIKDGGMILEFKVQDSEEKELRDTVEAALDQIDEKRYDIMLLEKGVAKEKIRKYGFAFCGKKVLIGER